MSREIKFRVKTMWCDEARVGQVSSIDDLDYISGHCYIELSSYSSDHHEWNTAVGDVLMQYTGIKDKNGVEIYEGDILWLGDAASIVQIVWVEFKLRLKWVNPMGASDNIYAWKDDLEVIGNIYENPELLEAINEQGND